MNAPKPLDLSYSTYSFSPSNEFLSASDLEVIIEMLKDVVEGDVCITGFGTFLFRLFVHLNTPSATLESFDITPNVITTLALLLYINERHPHQDVDNWFDDFRDYKAGYKEAIKRLKEKLLIVLKHFNLTYQDEDELDEFVRMMGIGCDTFYRQLPKQVYDYLNYANLRAILTNAFLEERIRWKPIDFREDFFTVENFISLNPQDKVLYLSNLIEYIVMGLGEESGAEWIDRLMQSYPSLKSVLSTYRDYPSLKNPQKEFDLSSFKMQVKVQNHD